MFTENKAIDKIFKKQHRKKIKHNATIIQLSVKIHLGDWQLFDAFLIPVVY